METELKGKELELVNKDNEIRSKDDELLELKTVNFSIIVYFTYILTLYLSKKSIFYLKKMLGKL